jgi:ribonuclease Z
MRHVPSHVHRTFPLCRYLFNAGEGFQRFCVQHQIKLNKLGDVLLTRLSTDASGGLPGVLHSTPQSNMRINLHGLACDCQ